MYCKNNKHKKMVDFFRNSVNFRKYWDKWVDEKEIKTATSNSDGRIWATGYLQNK